MTDDRNPITTLIMLWLVNISDGVVFDNRTVGDVHEELLGVARAVREVGLPEWADKIEIAAKSVRDTGPAAIINRLTEDLHATLPEAARTVRARGRQPPA